MPDPKDDNHDDNPIGLQEDGTILITPEGEPIPPWNPEVVDAEGNVTHPEGEDDQELRDDYEAFLDDDHPIEYGDDDE